MAHRPCCFVSMKKVPSGDANHARAAHVQDTSTARTAARAPGAEAQTQHTGAGDPGRARMPAAGMPVEAPRQPNLCQSSAPARRRLCRAGRHGGQVRGGASVRNAPHRKSARRAGGAGRLVTSVIWMPAASATARGFEGGRTQVHAGQTAPGRAAIWRLGHHAADRARPHRAQGLDGPTRTGSSIQARMPISRLCSVGTRPRRDISGPPSARRGSRGGDGPP